MANYVNNLAPVNLTGANNNPTNNSMPGAVISPNASATVISYFEELTGNKEAAQVLSSSIIFTASSQGIDPIGLIQQFKDLPPNQLNAYLVAFLNLNRVQTSLLGVQNQPKISKYVKRSIIP